MTLSKDCKDLIIGFGEIGQAIKTLLEKRGFKCDTLDLEELHSLDPKYDFIHICFPYSNDFISHVRDYQKEFSSENFVIHSTVKPGTSAALDISYSPVRGVHASMVEDLIYYIKYYAGKQSKEFEKRFRNTKFVDDITRLEATKILVDTTYYGWLIAFRKIVDDNASVYWEFAEEIQEKLGNRPIMYNDHKPIGGHCVVPNLDLIDIQLFKQVIK